MQCLLVVVVALSNGRASAGKESFDQRDLLGSVQRRFRPIFLTALTTFLGLAPMIFETSLQALFLVPMAISLGVGTVVSAVVVMTFIPAMMVIAEELGVETAADEVPAEAQPA
jgi:multidrug efflux pump subunit AcrB